MKVTKEEGYKAVLELRFIQNEMKRQYRFAVGRLVTSVSNYISSEEYDEILKMQVTNAYVELSAYIRMFVIMFPQFPAMRVLKNMDKLFLMRRTKK